MINKQVNIQLVDDQLRVYLQDSEDSDLIDLIKENKADLISFIRQHSLTNQLVNRGNAKEGYDLSHKETGKYHLGQLLSKTLAPEIDREIGGLNMAQFIRFDALDEPRFHQALRTLVGRHDLLRARFEKIDGVVRKIIEPLERFEFKVEIIDFSEIIDSSKELEIAVPKLVEASFDFSQPLWRAKLFRLHDGYQFCFVINHMIADMFSLHTLKTDFIELYHKGNDANLHPIELSARFISAWEKSLQEGANGAVTKAYWQSKLKGQLPTFLLKEWYQDPDQVHIPRGYWEHIKYEANIYYRDVTEEELRPLKGYMHRISTHDGSLYRVILRGADYEKIEKFTRKSSVSNLIMAALYLVLQQISRSNDLIIGFEKSLKELKFQDTTGWLSNTLLVRLTLSEDMTLHELMLLVKDTLMESFKYQTYPFDKVLEAQDISVDAIGGLSFNMERIESTDISLNLKEGKVNDIRPSYFDIDCFTGVYGNGLVFLLRYKTHLFDENQMEHFGQLINKTLLLLVERPEAQVSEISDYLSKGALISKAV